MDRNKLSNIRIESSVDITYKIIPFHQNLPDVENTASVEKAIMKKVAQHFITITTFDFLLRIQFYNSV